MNHPQHVFPSNANSTDVQTLLERVTELERMQLAEDVEGFVALFEPDALWVTGGGRRLVGRQQIADFTGQVLPGAFKNASVRYDVAVVSFLTPDVAVTGRSAVHRLQRSPHERRASQLRLGPPRSNMADSRWTKHWSR
jgi:uncharacterized protein (TIGR02246 family)